MKDKILVTFFTVVYFLIFCFLIDLIFRNTLSVFTDLLAVVCWIIAKIATPAPSARSFSTTLPEF